MKIPGGIKPALFALLASVLVACGGGGGGDSGGGNPGSTPAPAPTPTPTPTPSVSVAPPSDLSYPSPQIFTVGTPITGVTPTVNGTATNYAVEPPLPDGVVLSASTGVISGTPTAPAALGGYVIIASNSAGSSTYSLSISVRDNGGGSGGAISHSVNASAGAGGSVSPATSTVVHGATAAFTVAADPGFAVESVTGCGGTLTGNTYTTGPVTAECNVSAIFHQTILQVSAAAGAGGAIGPLAVNVNHHEVATFAVTAATGFRIAGVSGCGGSLNGSIFTTAAITSGCEAKAMFEPLSTVAIDIDVAHRRPQQENAERQYILDALLACSGGICRWNYAQPLGSAATVKYSFSGTANGYPNAPQVQLVYRDFSDVEKAAFREALQRISEVTLIDFVETNLIYGSDVINFAIGIGAGGLANYPPASAFAAQAQNGARVTIGQHSLAYLQRQPGQWAWDEIHDSAEGKSVIVHEIGHALGLKHSGNYAGEISPTLIKSEENDFYSVMSYRAGSDDHLTLAAATPQKYDLVALQYLYGTRPQSNQSKLYLFEDHYDNRSVIHDLTAQGILDITSSAKDSILDLAPGAFSSFGVNLVNYAVDTYGGYKNRSYNNLATSYDTRLKEVRSGSGNDIVYDNELDNLIETGGGNDVVFLSAGANAVDGGSGIDIVRYELPKNEYQVQAIQNGVVVEHLVSGRRDSLYSIEFIAFESVPYQTSELCLCLN